MPRDHLKDVKDHYDVVVIGSGLAGLTSANILARQGRSVLLLEQHYKLGGLATWFKRPGHHIFDISLHGFPFGMVKSCRRYWTKEIAESIVQLTGIRFENPMFSLKTSFTREDFTQLLIEKFNLEPKTVNDFFDTARGMNFYDDQETTARQLFDKFFPGREDVIRLLMEPITYANGSTLEDPAISYGIVFSNFMSKGVFTFRGGTDALISAMQKELVKNGVDIAIRSDCEKIHVKSDGDSGSKVTGVTVNGREIKCDAVVSNSNLMSTIFRLAGEEVFDKSFIDQAKEVRVNNSSTQVYIGLKPDDPMEEEEMGDLLFTSTAPTFNTEQLLSRDITSRTYSLYYPQTRPAGRPQKLIVSSTNARWEDWDMPEEEYEASKKDLCETTLDALETYAPNIRERAVHVEASTPRTFNHYTQHVKGASFGTKFEGLAVSRALSQQVKGLFHAGSVGIIMSGWLGAMNYGVIVANEVDSSLMTGGSASTDAAERDVVADVSAG